MPNAPDTGSLVLSFLSLGLIANEDELRQSIRRSFAFNHYFDDEEGRDRFLADVMESLGDLEANDLTRHDESGFTITELGRVASASGMSLNSFYRLLGALADPGMSIEHLSELLPLLCELEEFESIRPYDGDARAGVLGEWMSGRPTAQIIEIYSGQYEVGSGHIRRIGETAAWMLNTAARIADVPDLVAEGDVMSRRLTQLAQRCKFGVPNEVVPIAELRVLHRSELNLLLNNSAGRVLDTPHKILDASIDDFRGILSPQRAERLQAAILAHIGETVSSRKFGHVVRANRFPGLRPLIEKCYEQRGTDLEHALEELFKAQIVALDAHRFRQQRTGQPDLEVRGSAGTIVIQVTASEDDRKPVNWAKAREVLASVGYSGQASNFVVVARPGFHDVAIGNADEIASRGDQNLLLIPLTELIEVFISETEGKIAKGSLLEVLENARGHFVADELPDLPYERQ